MKKIKKRKPAGEGESEISSDILMPSRKKKTKISKEESKIDETESLSSEEKKIKREKVIYPGYVFLKTNDISTLKEYIKNIDGSFGLLTTRDGEIQSISEFEINKMLKILIK